MGAVYSGQRLGGNAVFDAVFAAAGGGATALTLSGPSGGTVGVASTAFTVGANGTVAGGVTYTPSDAGGGGTFTPVTGTPPGTFTYTPSSAGAKTISITNNGGLTNPASVTYTASAVGATSTTLSGPSSGTVLVASTAYTVGANGAITGTVVVTPNDAGNGGTFAPTTVSISSATPTGTFSYTPATAGTKTIATSNSGGLSNAPSLTYISYAAGSLTNYPAYIQYQDGREPWLLGRKILRASNGAPRGRSFFTTRKKVFQITHRGLTTAEKYALGTFYDANTNSSFSFICDGDGVAYTVIFGAADIEWSPMEGGRWNCTVELLQT